MSYKCDRCNYEQDEFPGNSKLQVDTGYYKVEIIFVEGLINAPHNKYCISAYFCDECKKLLLDLLDHNDFFCFGDCEKL